MTQLTQSKALWKVPRGEEQCEVCARGPEMGVEM